MYEDEITEKIKKANEKFEDKTEVNRDDKDQRIRFMQRLLSPLRELSSLRIYEIGNGEEWLRIVNLTGDRIKLMYSSSSSGKDEKDYSYDALARLMTEGSPVFPLILKEILESSFDEITLERLS